MKPVLRKSVSLAVFLLLLAPAGACHKKDGPDVLTVMTQNLYVGCDLEPLLAAASPDEVPVLAAQAFQQLLATNFPERAEAIADVIARKRPGLIALQEVSTIRVQSPGDAVAGGTVPADAVLFDYLQILQAALAARGLDYRVAGRIENIDVEVPMLTGTSPLSFDDIRLTDADVVLARADVSTSNVAEVTYAAKLPVPGLGIDIPRGYVALDASWGSGRTVRFVATHLEDSPFPTVQMAQAQELAAAMAAETRMVVLAGDFNSPATDGVTYAALAVEGYEDTWRMNLKSGQGAGLTWGHDSDLRNATATFTMRIDLVLARSAPGLAVLAEVWGDDPDERTSTGMWPSDHAGVITRLEMPKP